MEESVKQAAQYSPLVLAYLGDAVYELYIRERIVAGGNQPVNRMHGKAVHFVKAETQAKLLRYLEPELTEAPRTQCPCEYDGKECEHDRLPPRNRV